MLTATNTLSLTSEHIHLIQATALAADKDRYQPVLSCVCLRIQDGRIVIVATDGKLLVEHIAPVDTTAWDFSLSSEILIQVKENKPVLSMLSKHTGTIDLQISVEGIATLNGIPLHTLDTLDTDKIGPGYPAYDTCLNREPYLNKVDMNCFALSTVYLSKIEKALCMPKHSKAVTIYPQGERKGIILKPTFHHMGEGYDKTALIMPVTLPK